MIGPRGEWAGPEGGLLGRGSSTGHPLGNAEGCRYVCGAEHRVRAADGERARPAERGAAAAGEGRPQGTGAGEDGDTCVGRVSR